MITAYYWKKGGSSVLNQDSLFLLRLRTGAGEMAFGAVCDGIGGWEAGEKASGYLTEQLMECVYRSLVPALAKNKWKIASNAAYRTLYSAREALCAYGLSKHFSLGTTVCFACLFRGRFLALHCGDSRLYKIGILGTKSLFPDDLKEGRLTACIGSVRGPMPKLRLGRLLPGEGLLLCSDGFYRGLTDKELGESLGVRDGRLRGEMLARRLRTLSEEAVLRGSRDDAAVVYLGNRRDPGG